MELTWLDGQMMRQRKNKCRDDEAFVATNLSKNATNSSARYVGWTAWCFFSPRPWHSMRVKITMQALQRESIGLCEGIYIWLAGVYLRENGLNSAELDSRDFWSAFVCLGQEVYISKTFTFIESARDGVYMGS